MAAIFRTDIFVQETHVCSCLSYTMKAYLEHIWTSEL